MQKINNKKMWDSCVASIKESADKEIKFDDFKSMDNSKVSFVCVQHTKQTVELFVSNKEGWCDLNYECVYKDTKLKYTTKDDVSVVKILKSQTIEDVITELCKVINADVETAIVYI